MPVVSLAISQERQRASHLRLLQTVWADRDYGQVEAWGREGQDGDSYSRGYYACRRHYMLSALCVADLSTANIHNNPFGNNDIWPLLEKDIRIGPWTWAAHADLVTWVLVHGLMGNFYHATNFPEYTPRAYPESVRLSSIGKDAIRTGFGAHGGRSMDFGPPILVPLHAPVTSNVGVFNVAVTAGSVQAVSVMPTEGVGSYTYSLSGDAPDWMVLEAGVVQLRPPIKHPGGTGEAVVTIMDSEGQRVDVVIVWAVTPATPTQ